MYTAAPSTVIQLTYLLFVVMVHFTHLENPTKGRSAEVWLECSDLLYLLFIFC